MNKPTWQKMTRELKDMLGLFLYLAFFFCTFITYRGLVMEEMCISYFHYGFALVKALVLTKVIMIGQHTRVSRRLDASPLIVPTLYKVMVFTFFAIAFEIIEHALESLLHHKPMIDAIREILSVGRNELLARMLMLLAAFLPLFAFREVGRVLGEGRLYGLFLKNRPPAKSEN